MFRLVPVCLIWAADLACILYAWLNEDWSSAGVDYSRHSIEYAAASAEQHKLDIRYRYQDYLTLEDRRRIRCGDVN